MHNYYYVYDWAIQKNWEYESTYKNKPVEIFNTQKFQMQGSETNKGATTIIEQNRELFVQGKAKIYTKYVSANQKGQMIENGVFYNPVQIFNRDFTLLVMQAHINQQKKLRGEKFEGVTIVDALSASGLRTIRFLKQLEGIKVVYANDISPASHKLMRDNFDLNKLDQSKLKMTMQDANLLLQNQKKNLAFDIIDLDPYGSVVPFLDAAVDTIRDGGLLCITCTDTKVTCGPDISKCYYYYGTVRSRVPHFNQNALRIVLNTISSAASRHCKYIQPILSFQTDFYLRVFVIVRKGKKQCAQSGTKIGNVFACQSCGNYEYHSHLTQKNKHHGVYVPNRVIINSVNCQICKTPYSLNGPIWLGEINRKQFVQSLMDMIKDQNFKLELKTQKKIYGTLHGILEEKQLSKIPLGFSFDLMCKNVKATTPNRKILYAGLESLGFQVQPSYISPGIYKTNAPLKAVYDVIKTWKLKQTGQQKYLYNVKQQFSLNILNEAIQYKPNFQFEASKHKKVAKFISMGANMGPKGKPESRVLTQKQVKQLVQLNENQDSENQDLQMNKKQKQKSQEKLEKAVSKQKNVQRKSSKQKKQEKVVPQQKDIERQNSKQKLRKKSNPKKTD